MIRKSIIAMLALTIFPAVSYGDKFTGTYTVTGITLDKDFFSGCLAKVTPSPTVGLPGCRAGFVTFDCRGELGVSKTQSSLHLSAAQLALVTDTKVVIRINDDLTANRFCLAERIDNTKNPS